MGVQLLHPFHHQFDVAMQQFQGVANGPGLFAHARVLQDGAHRVQRRHAGRGRYDPDPCVEAFADDVGEIGVQFGIDGLGRQEHQRAIGRLAFEDVFFRNRLDMRPDRGLERLRGGARFGVGGSIAQRLIGLEREFRVDHDRTRRVGQMDQAIRPLAVRQGLLQRIAVLGQRLGHDVGQLDFPEGPARLLVRQDVLQRQHIARELGDILLRAVDRGQPRLQFRQAFRGAFGPALQLLVHAFLHVRQGAGGLHGIVVQPVGHLLLNGGQPRLHRLDDLRLGVGLGIRHGRQPAGQLFLPPAKRIDGAAHLVHLVDQRLGRLGGTADPAQGGDQQDHDQQAKGRSDQQGQGNGVVQVKGHRADLHQVRPKSRSISDSFSST